MYPNPHSIFRAFQLTPFEEVKVVMIAQDPYPWGEHADGLAFSSKLEETPASLRTILREVDRDVVHTTNIKEFKEAFPTNDLGHWAKQGVLLINTQLTVRANEPMSHKELGWNKFISTVLERLYSKESPKVFMLWGAEAKDLFFKLPIDDDKEGLENNKILSTGHPATAARGNDLFSGNGHFSKTNHWLEKQGMRSIEWSLTPTKGKQ